MEVVDFFGDFLENASLLLNYILDAFSMLNIFNDDSPIKAGIIAGFTNLGLEINVSDFQLVIMIIFAGLFIGVISFAVGIFLRIAGSR